MERTKPGRPVFSPPALRLLNARVEKTGWTLHEFEKRGKGGEPFLSSADVKIAFKSFEDALVTFYLPDKPQSLDAQLLDARHGARGEEEKAWKAGKKGKKGACRKKFNRLTRCLVASIRGENSVIVFLYGCHRVV